MTKSETIKLLAMLSAAYPNMKEINKVQVELWCECLKDISKEEGLKSARKHILDSPFPPTIADIRNIKVNKKTRFHNFNQRSDRYTAAELEEICRRKREKYSMKLQNQQVLSLEHKDKR